MAHNLPDETLSLFAVGALEKNEMDQLITLLKSMEHTRLDKIGTYQFMMSLIPTTMKLDSPDPKVKEAVAKKLLSFQDEILKKIQARLSGEKEVSVKAAAPISVEGADNREKQSISDGLEKADPEPAKLSDSASEVENFPPDDSNAGMETEILSDNLVQETEEIAEELQTEDIKNFLDEEFSSDGFNIEQYDEISNPSVDHLNHHDETFAETPEEIVAEEFDIPDDISLSSESNSTENDILPDNADLLENNSVRG